jgi:hypothetical protein
MEPDELDPVGRVQDKIQNLFLRLESIGLVSFLAGVRHVHLHGGSCLLKIDDWRLFS